MRSTYVLLGVAALLTLVKLVESAGLPLCVHANATYDDAWAVNAAYNIANGDWLGPYNSVTLIKNPGFPLYLALLKALGINYLTGTALLYTAACALFTWALRPAVKGNGWLLFIYLVLLFNPVSMATDTFQRVYRNSLTAPQALLVFGSYVAVYLRCKKRDDALPSLRSLAPWMMVGAASLAWFWLTREDSIWIAPFVGVATAVIVVRLQRVWLRQRRAEGAARTAESAAESMAVSGVVEAGTKPLGAGVRFALSLVFMLLPLGTVFGSMQAIKSINESHYGLATTAEINSGNFARFIKDLYAIQPEALPENQRVACPHSSVEAAYSVSPTLASIQPQVEDSFYNWGDVYDNDPGDGEVNGGEFFWVLRIAGEDAGVYSTDAAAADAFWGRCASEIEAAFDADALARRAIMPSSIMSPWRAEYAGQLLPTLGDIVSHLCTYEDVTMEHYAPEGSADGIAFFEQVTGNKAPSAREVGWQPLLVLFTGPFYFIVGAASVFAGVVLTLRLFVEWAACRIKPKEGAEASSDGKSGLGAVTLVAVALLCGMLCLLAALTYTRVSSFTPINYYYYGSALYPLSTALGLLVLHAYSRFDIDSSKRRSPAA